MNDCGHGQLLILSQTHGVSQPNIFDPSRNSFPGFQAVVVSSLLPRSCCQRRQELDAEPQHTQIPFALNCCINKRLYNALESNGNVFLASSFHTSHGNTNKTAVKSQLPKRRKKQSCRMRLNMVFSLAKCQNKTCDSNTARLRFTVALTTLTGKHRTQATVTSHATMRLQPIPLSLSQTGTIYFCQQKSPSQGQF